MSDLFGEPEPSISPSEPDYDSVIDDLEDDTLSQGNASLLLPQETQDLIGHQDVEKQLLSLIEKNKLPHAMIFSGIKGIGKSVVAYRLARFLLHHNPHAVSASQDALFGGEEFSQDFGTFENLAVPFDSRAYQQVLSGAHPDFRVIERVYDEGKKKHRDNVDVDSIRKIPEFMRMKASDGGWKVVIVDDANTMNRNAQNAILKILEEPPERSVLVLVTHRLSDYLPTIRSRCRIINFTPLDQDSFKTLILKEHAALGIQELETLYAMTEGSVGQALDIIEQGGLDVLDGLLSLFSEWPKLDWEQIHTLGMHFGAKGQDKGFDVFCFLMTWFSQAILRAKAYEENLPALIRNSSSLQKMMTDYDLREWLELCTSIEDVLNEAKRYNLDKHTAMINLFSLLKRQH